MADIVGLVSRSFHSTAEYCHDKAYHCSIALRDQLKKPAVFEKTLQIGVSIITLKNNFCGTKSLPLLANQWKVIGVQNLFNLARQPHNWLFSVSAASIDKTKVLERLTTFLYTTFQDQLAVALEEGQIRGYPLTMETMKKDARIIARYYLKEQFKGMEKNNDRYFDEAPFVHALENKMKKDGLITVIDGEVYRTETPHALTYDLKRVDLSGLRVPLVKVSLISHILALNWVAVDLFAMTFALKTWKLVDTEKIASSMGQITSFGKPFLGFILEKPIQIWLKGSLFTAFALKLVLVSRDIFSNKHQLSILEREKLKVKALPTSSKRKVHLNLISSFEANLAITKKRLVLEAISSLADLILVGVLYLQEIKPLSISNNWVHGIGLFARGIGIGCIVYMPKKPTSIDFI
jgi:hypothetical protein